MSAWELIQKEWADNSDEKNTTGVLLWDLTAAFDTLDSDILCSKLKLYGFQESTMLLSVYHSTKLKYSLN